MSSSRRTLSSVSNAARVLKSFSSTQADLGVTELAARLELGKSTVHRLLTTLVDERFVEQDNETGRYRLGIAAYELGAAASSPTDLHQAVLTPMAVLRVRSGETVQVGVLDGRQVVYVERLESVHTLRLFLDVGTRNDAHCTGSGKCLLAFLPPAHLDHVLRGWELPAHTEHTITDHRQLREDLDDTRRRGWAENHHESELGMISIAAPIRGSRQKVVASLSVAGPAERMAPRHQQMVTAVLEAAATASRRVRI